MKRGYRIWIALPFFVAFAIPLGGQKAIAAPKGLAAVRERPLVLTETVIGARTVTGRQRRVIG